MKLYIAAKIGQYIAGYAEFTISSSYETYKDCIDHCFVENGSNIIIVVGDRFINGIVVDKASHTMSILKEGDVKYLESSFNIIKHNGGV